MARPRPEPAILGGEERVEDPGARRRPGCPPPRRSPAPPPSCAGRRRDPPCRRAGSRLTRVTSVSWPPSAIASIALRTRLWNTCTSRSSSPRIGGRLGSYRRTIVTRRSRAVSSLRRATRSSSWCRFERHRVDGRRPGEVQQHLDDAVDAIDLGQQHARVLVQRGLRRPARGPGAGRRRGWRRAGCGSRGRGRRPCGPPRPASRRAAPRPRAGGSARDRAAPPPPPPRGRPDRRAAPSRC